MQRIREFRNRPNPTIVVTVDMLSTGVDIPALEFIVFLRPIKSRILWEQMLGRGTRRCPDINKSHFTVFDCFNGTCEEDRDEERGPVHVCPRTSATPSPCVTIRSYRTSRRRCGAAGGRVT